MQVFSDPFLPHVIRLRLAEFASRMPEVGEPGRRNQMADALFEIRRNLTRMVTGGDLSEVRPRDDDGERSLRAMIALLEDARVHTTEENVGTLRDVSICIDHMFEGVDVDDEPPASHCRVRLAG